MQSRHCSHFFGRHGLTGLAVGFLLGIAIVAVAVGIFFLFMQ